MLDYSPRLGRSGATEVIGGRAKGARCRARVHELFLDIIIAHLYLRVAVIIGAIIGEVNRVATDAWAGAEKGRAKLWRKILSHKATPAARRGDVSSGCGPNAHALVATRRRGRRRPDSRQSSLPKVQSRVRAKALLWKHRGCEPGVPALDHIKGV